MFVCLFGLRSIKNGRLHYMDSIRVEQHGTTNIRCGRRAKLSHTVSHRDERGANIVLNPCMGSHCVVTRHLAG
jgi:hypothetical protein